MVLPIEISFFRWHILSASTKCPREICGAMLPPSPFCAVELDEAGVPIVVNETFITIMGPLYKFAGFAFFEAAADPEGKNLLAASIGRVRDGSPRERVRHVQMITLAGESGLPIKSHFDWFLCPGATGAGVVALHGDPCSDEIIEQREKDRELIDFFQNAPIALHWLSGTGHVLWANQTELDVLGYSREEYIGQPIMKFCPDEEELVLEIFKTLGSGNTIRDVPVRFRTKQGKIVHLLIDSNVAYKVDEEGNKTFNHTRCFIRDDTGRRMREARVNARLKEMELSRKQLDQFMSRTLHLIKTPLHIMQSSNDMAMDELMDLSFSLSPRERESLTHALGRMQTITGQLDEITRLIVDTSDVMRFEHGAEMRLHEERTDLAALGEKCVAEAKAAKQGVEIKLEVAEADRLCAMVDAKILQRSLMHLLRNAVAATPAGGLVTLEIKMSDPVGQRVRFMVSDTGHGLSTNLKHVFDRYHAGVLSTDDSSKLSEEDIDSVHQKLASTLSFSSKNTTGLGVGLNLTYGLVRSLGGELCYQSSSTGSQFWFVIPMTICDPLEGSECTHVNLSSMLSRCESPDDAEASFTNMSESDGGTFKKRTPSAELLCSFAEAIAKEGLQAMQAPHVLVVEDTDMCAMCLQGMLSKLGCTSERAEDGAEALRMMKNNLHLYSLVLMDLRMPVMDGFETTQRIREELASQVPIIALTADECSDTRHKCKSLGFTAFASKPLKYPELKNLLAAHDKSFMAMGRTN